MGRHDPLSEEWTREVEQRIDRALQLHQALPNQGHWRCGCAKQEHP